MNSSSALLVFLVVVAAVISVSGSGGKAAAKKKAAIQYIIAPRGTPVKKSGFETTTIGPAGYACAKMNLQKPEDGYLALQNYLSGSTNVENKKFNDVTAWPIMETRNTDPKNNEVCIYLPKQDHCYPPKPKKPAMPNTFTVNEHFKKPYVRKSFWGQASDARVKYELAELKKKATTAAIKNVDFNSGRIAYWPDHEREVRYDIKKA